MWLQKVKLWDENPVGLASNALKARRPLSMA
jgi:hypothetical protein